MTEALRLVVVDDGVADGWAPFALTRPCCELLFGRWTLRERLERVTRVPAAAVLTRPWLAGFREPGVPPVAAPTDIGSEAERVYLLSRAVPDPGQELPDQPSNLWIDGYFVGCRLAAGEPSPEAEWRASPSPDPRLPDVSWSGLVLERMWDLVRLAPDRLAADLAGDEAEWAPLPTGVWQKGQHGVRLGEGTEIEPGVFIDSRAGPIEVGDRCEVRSGTRLVGPVYVGPDSMLLGGLLEAVCAGPVCRLRGEIGECVLLGYDNKAHDGFLGHAYVGRWVNLGALTTNSDLKNNYGTVRVGPPGMEEDTGLTKLGCLIGDHVRTGIGLMINTGTVIGAGSSVWGDMPPKWVPPFSWGSGQELGEYRHDAFIETAATVMGRRGVVAGSEERQMLSAIWQEARG